MQGAPWRNPRVLYTLLCVFLTGAVAGAITMRMGIAPERHAPSPYWKSGTAKELSLQRLKKELDLTPEQAKQMELVLDDFLSYYQTLQVQMDDVLATGKHRIKAILRDDQKSRFDRLIGELQKK